MRSLRWACVMFAAFAISAVAWWRYERRTPNALIDVDTLVSRPILLTNIPQLMGVVMPIALQKHLELMIFGGLIVFFLIVEPHGLARLWQITKEKLRLWPFPH